MLNSAEGDSSLENVIVGVGKPVAQFLDRYITTADT